MLSRLEALRQRNRQPEVMDQPGLDPALHRGALRDLARLHRMTGTVRRRLWPPIEKLARGGPVRVLDLACGGGSVAVDLALRAARKRLALEVEGADISSTALEFARGEAHARGVDVRFFQLDALAGELPAYDVIVTSLFLHHLSRDQVVSLLRRMAEAAGRLVLCEDLIRGLAAWVTTYTGCRLFFRSPVVRVDGPLSVAASFTPAELGELAARAGLAEVRITRSWPQRQLLIWRKR